MPPVFTVNGVAKGMQRGWSVRLTANGRAQLRCKLFSEDGSYRPALDQETILTDGAVVPFGGYIIALSEAGAGNEGIASIMTDVTAGDYHLLTQIRHIQTGFVGGNLKAALNFALTYLPGITLDAGQIDGPAIPEMPIDLVKVEEFLDAVVKAAGPGYVWEITSGKKLRSYVVGTLAAPFNIVSGPNGLSIRDVMVEPTRKGYANRVIVRAGTLSAMQESVPAQTAVGKIWEKVLRAPDNWTQEAIDALAVSELASALVLQRRVRYTTLTAGLFPGMTQTINLPSRGVNNTFMITDVEIFDIKADGVLEYRVTALEGVTVVAGWQDDWKGWSTSGQTIGGSLGVGGSGHIKRSHFLGGSGLEGTQSPTPTWVPASGGGVIGQGAIQAKISTVERGSTFAKVEARLRADEVGVSVQARLYDVTDGVACPGLSAVVTNTSWEFVSFDVELTPGDHIYELQLLPGAVNKVVYGTGSVK